MGRYVEISGDEFQRYIEAEMKFHEVQLDGVFERTWEFDVNDSFSIRVYSTIDKRGDVSRDIGKDAIRCLIIDRSTQRILKMDARVHRTKNALPNMRDRCRELYKHIRDNQCGCGGLLVTRSGKSGKFLGCSNYPTCKNTKPIPNEIFQIYR